MWALRLYAGSWWSDARGWGTSQDIALCRAGIILHIVYTCFSLVTLMVAPQALRVGAGDAMNAHKIPRAQCCGGRAIYFGVVIDIFVSMLIICMCVCVCVGCTMMVWYGRVPVKRLGVQKLCDLLCVLFFSFLFVVERAALIKMRI